MKIDSKPEKDYFWLYIGVVTVVLIGIMAGVKFTSSEKYDPIRGQLSEESARMNIRVVN